MPFKSSGNYACRCGGIFNFRCETRKIAIKTDTGSVKITNVELGSKIETKVVKNIYSYALSNSSEWNFHLVSRTKETC